jgi:hypothetical protein
MTGLVMDIEPRRDSSNDRRPVSATERRWVLWLALVVMVITTLPYLVGYAAQGSDHRFSGFVIGAEDGNSYVAKMLAGTYGAWLFRSPYTAYPQKGMLIFLPYLLLGKLAAPPGLHEQLIALFHLFRIVAGVLEILATYEFLAFFLDNIRARRLGVALVTLGGGLGWLLVMFGLHDWSGSFPLDFFSPETFGFLGVYGVPHLALARALMLWALLAFVKAATKEFQANSKEEIQKSAPLFAIAKVSFLWLLAGLVQPLDTVEIGMVVFWYMVCLLVWQAFRKTGGASIDWIAWRRLIRLTILAGILPGLLALYNAWMYFRDPYVTSWMSQSMLRSPHPFHYLVAFGMVAPYAWFGGRSLLRKRPTEGWLLVGWIILLPVLAYLPLSVQRRLPDGIWVAWVALVMVALEEWASRTKTSQIWKRYLPFAPLCLLFLSTFFLLAGGFRVAMRAAQPLFRQSDEIAVFEWIGSNAEPGSIVLTSYETGNPLPAWAPAHVLIGLGSESIHLEALQTQVKAFYSASTPDVSRNDLTDRLNIDYVFYGPSERALGDWNPELAPYLSLVFRAGDYSLFETYGHINQR